MTEITIRNNDDARFWEMVLKHAYLKSPERIKETKRALRAYYNRPVYNPDTDGRVFDDTFDGCFVLKPFPESITSFEEAEEDFQMYERIEYRPTYYDCTGQLFTSWHKIFRKPDGRFWLYHRIDRDV